MVDGMALEDGEEKKNEADGCGERNRGIEDVCVYAIDGNAQKSDDDGDFGDDTSDNVEDLAQPPALLAKN